MCVIVFTGQIDADDGVLVDHIQDMKDRQVDGQQDDSQQWNRKHLGHTWELGHTPKKQKHTDGAEL